MRTNLDADAIRAQDTYLSDLFMAGYIQSDKGILDMSDENIYRNLPKSGEVIFLTDLGKQIAEKLSSEILELWWFSTT